MSDKNPNKILASFILYKRSKTGKKPIIFGENFNLDDIWFFARNKVADGLRTYAKLFVESASVGEISSVLHDDKRIIIYPGHDGISSLVVVSDSYDSIPTLHQMLYIMIRNFKSTQFYKDFFEEVKNGDVDRANKETNEMLSKLSIEYEHPEKVDKIYAIKKELESTKKILYDTIDKLLERKEILDNLVYKTEELADLSKDFKVQTKKLNRCCSIL